MNGWRIAGRVCGVVALATIFLVKGNLFDAATTAFLWWGLFEFIGWRVGRNKAAFRLGSQPRWSESEAVLTLAEDVTVGKKDEPSTQAPFQPDATTLPNPRRSNSFAVVFCSVICSVLCSTLVVIFLMSPSGVRIVSQVWAQQARDSASSEVQPPIVSLESIPEPRPSLGISNANSLELANLASEVESLRLKTALHARLLSDANINVQAALDNLAKQQQNLFGQQQSLDRKLREADVNVQSVLRRNGLLR